MVQKKLDKISGYLYRIEFDYTTQKYFVIAALPLHWVFKTQLDVTATDLKEANGVSLLFKLTSSSVDNILENLEKVIKHNARVDELEAKLKKRIQDKKQRLTLEEQNISKAVSEMKNNIASDLENDLKDDKSEPAEIPIKKVLNFSSKTGELIPPDDGEVTERFDERPETVERDTD